MTHRMLAIAFLFVAAPLVSAQKADERELNAAYRKASDFTKAGKYTEAIPEWERALALTRKIYGPNHREVGIALSNLGGTRSRVDDFKRAEEELTEAIRILGGVAGKEDETATQTRLILGTVKISLKKYDEAVRELTTGLQSLEVLRGADHLDVAICCEKLGNAVRGQNRSDAAEAYHRRALVIREKHLPADALPIADSLHALAYLALDSKQWAKGEELFQRAAAIRERQEDDFVLARMDPEKSKRYMARQKADITAGRQASIRIDSSVLQLMHEWVMLSTLTKNDGRMNEAANWADRYCRLQRAMLPILLAQSADLGNEQNNEHQTSGLMELTLKAPKDPAVAALSVSWSMNAKGTLAEVLTEKLCAAKDDPKLAALLVELQTVRSDIATATLAKPAPADTETHAKSLRKLVDREKEIQDSSVMASASLETASSGWVDTMAVRKALPPDAVYIDFARVGYEGKQRYAAWVVPPVGKGDVRAFDLGDADAVDAIAEALRDSIQAAPRDIAKLGEAAAFQKLDKLFAATAKRLLQPILASADAYPQWIISPDAGLWMLPWAALPVGNGKFLIEDRTIRFVVSGREFVAPATKPDLAIGSSVILADPDYDANAGAATANSLPTPDVGVVVRTAGMKFNRLPGTATEAVAVRPKLAAWTKGEPVMKLGADATEQAFKSAVRPRALILSTHGYYLSGTSGAAGTRGLIRDDNPVKSAPSGADALPNKPTGPGNPLFRCGLALAGANRRGPLPGNHDDGVLTGYEIVAADLRGTELVVLSACETGLGATGSGRGVVGLRQAFHLAGAQSVVASLWQVPDRETALLMTGMFAHLADGRTAALALIASQRDQIRARRTAISAAHPFYWAAFNVSGIGR